MAFEFKLPDLGEGVAEGEIVAWKVKEGDKVGEDQPLVEVMTDKATVEIPSPRSGTIAKIHYKPGQVVPVGTIIVAIEEGQAAAKPAAAAPAPAAPAHGHPAPTAHATAAPTAKAAAAPARAADEKVLATPATRKLARDLGLELGAIPGTGPRGRVTRDDVRTAATPAAPAPVAALERPAPARPSTPAVEAETPAAPVAAAPSAGGVQRIPFRGIRKKIADQMVRSAFTSPHFTLVEEVDMTEVDKLRDRAKPAAEKAGVKLTFLPFVVKALVAALKKHPTLNSALDEQAGEQLVFSDVHVGFALDTDRGLMVPVIRDAHRKNVFEVAADLGRLADEGRKGTIARENLVGSTITITSAGSIGGLFATPILNYPEVAILGVYRMEERPVVKDGQIVVRKMMYLSVTLDHRVVDGGEAARFMNTMKRYLGDPTTLILEG